MSGLEIAALSTTGGVLSVAAALGTTVMGIVLALTSMTGKRKRRHADGDHQQFEKDEILIAMMYKLLNEIDNFDCTALALCDAVALSDGQRTSAQDTIVALLSPEPGTPLAWSDVRGARAKFQYASFVGSWASMTSNGTHCRRAFPNCPLQSSEIFNIMTSENIIPCQNTLKNLNIVNE